MTESRSHEGEGGRCGRDTYQWDTPCFRPAGHSERCIGPFGYTRELAGASDDDTRRGRALDAALRLADQWNDGWTGAVRYAEWSREYEILTDCADQLLQALSPVVLPMIEAVGVVPWPDHDEQAVHERIAQKSDAEGSPLPLGGPKHTPTAENCTVGGPGAPISSGLVCRACPPIGVGA